MNAGKAQMPLRPVLALLLLAACATPPAPRENDPESLDPRITPLTLEQQRHISE